MTLDVLFTNARVVDGTGATWFHGSVGVRDDQIEYVSLSSNPDRSAEIKIDTGKSVIAPGFIDAHSHADLALFIDSSLEPKIRQGVTTEVVGQDGLSVAPVKSEAVMEWARYLRPIVGQADSKVWTWETTAEYFEALERVGSPSNISTLVGHGTVRYEVLGMTDREPTENELQEMKKYVGRALDSGAVGFSTGLEYSPHCHANTEEVRRLATQLAPCGRPFVAHIRSYSHEMWSALDEFIDIGASEDIPVHLSHFKVGGSNIGLHDRALELARAARDRGVDFTADLYPYVPGNTMLQAILPAWVHIGGPESVIARLKNDDDREQIKREMVANNGAWDMDWEHIFLSHVASAENEAYLGQSLAESADDEGVDPFGFMCDLLIEEDLEVAFISLETAEQAEDDIRAVLREPLVAIGSDAIFGKHPHPRLFGTYPRILGHYVRDLNLLSIEEAVRKMTSLPARIFGFNRKGIIRPGMDADLVVFDPLNVGSDATVENPRRYPTGIDHVMVNGEFVVRNQELTGATPGSVLRS